MRFLCNRSIVVRCVSPSLFAALFVTAVPAWGGSPEEVIVTGHRYSDPCLAIAAAKVAQWNQPRLRRVKTQIFADGSIAKTETIMTANTAYRRKNNETWHTAQVTRGNRRAGSPALVEKKMGLANCRLDETDGQSADAATSYLFQYAANRDGSRPSGEMLISNASGLPLRQELQETSQPAGRKLPVRVTIEYSYGNDVQVPLAAEEANNWRLFKAQQCVRELQAPSPTPAATC